MPRGRRATSIPDPPPAADAPNLVSVEAASQGRNPIPEPMEDIVFLEEVGVPQPSTSGQQQKSKRKPAQPRPKRAATTKRAAEGGNESPRKRTKKRSPKKTEVATVEQPKVLTLSDAVEEIQKTTTEKRKNLDEEVSVAVYSASAIRKLMSELEIGGKIYEKSKHYYDAGYIVKTTKVLGIEEEAWKTRCCNFTIELKSAMPAAAREGLARLSHFRLLITPEAGRSVLIFPLRFADENKIQPYAFGDIFVPGDAEKFRDAICAVPSTALRAEDFEPIPIPPIPKALANEWGWQKPSFHRKDKDQVRSLFMIDEVAEYDGKISFTVFVHLTSEFLSEDSNPSTTFSVHETTQNERVRYLLECGKAIEVSDNPFLETLVNETKYDPRKQALNTETERRAFGHHISPQIVADLFHAVKAAHADQGIAQVDPQHPTLILQLHEYQKRAVSWMMAKEKASFRKDAVPHPLYVPFETLGGERLFIRHTSPMIFKTRPTVTPSNVGILADEMGLGKTLEVISLIVNHPREDTPLPRLPDSFVSSNPEPKEVIQCICRNIPKNATIITCAECGLRSHGECMKGIPRGQQFLCIKCQRNHRIISGATLVVAPKTIIDQWISEIHKSVGFTLSVYDYHGIAKEGYVSPWSLAKYDIVMASYEMLSNEILYLEAEDRKNGLRNPTARAVPPSPLLAIRFWRFVLDEAQMVESQSANYSKMAFMIQSQFYWAVTGTPIQKGIADIQALLNFVEAAPWTESCWFSQYLAAPFDSGIRGPLYDVFAENMWRLEKADVENEMNLPPCTTVIHTVQFTGIERQLYQQVYRDCVNMIAGKIRNRRYGADIFDKKYTDLDSELFKVVKTWIARLMILCISPTKVGYFFNTPAKKAQTVGVELSGQFADSLAHVAQTLMKKAKEDLQDKVRACVMTENAMAGLYWLQNDHRLAAGMYRAAMKLWKEMETHFELDATQRLHVLYNLGKLIEEHGDEKQVEEDSELMNQANALIEAGRAKSRALLDDTVKKLNATWKIENAEGQGTSRQSRADAEFAHSEKDLMRSIGGLHAILESISDQDLADELLHYVRMNSEETIGTRKGTRGVQSKARALNKTWESIAGLKLVLHNRWDEIIKSRKDVLSKMDSVLKNVQKQPDEVVNEAAACHHRFPPSVHRCGLCKIEKTFNSYEDLIFVTLIDDGEGDDSNKAYRKNRKFDKNAEDERQTQYRAGDFEKTCKTIVQFCRRLTKRPKVPSRVKAAVDGMEEDIKRFFEVMDLLKKEQLNVRAAWRNIYNYAAACDEMKQAVVRIRIMTEDEEAQYVAMSTGEKTKYIKNNAVLTRNVSVPAEIKKQDAKLKSEQVQMSQAERHFRYITNMTDAYTRTDDVQRRECCICIDVVEDNWSLLPCYHILCTDCLDQMRAEDYRWSRPSCCPMCRKMIPQDEIVSSKSILKSSPKKIERHTFSASGLRGVPSKMEEVVGVAKGLIDADPGTKILIFSDYAEVLDDYLEVFRRVSIPTKLCTGKADLPKLITALKEDQYNILLMPVHMGGKGLTITEANHVFFLEPLMNKAAELQAIGRIHRMGQTKPTFVHKFIVQDTVEEKMHEMMTSIGTEGSLLSQDMTLRQILDVLKNASHHGPSSSLQQWISLTTGLDENGNPVSPGSILPAASNPGSPAEPIVPDEPQPSTSAGVNAAGPSSD